MNLPTKNLAVALTGASGAPYFLRLIERIRALQGLTIHLIASSGGLRVLETESSLGWEAIVGEGMVRHSNKNIGACIASGSFQLDAMVILPCSQNTLCAIATGLAGNLIQRTAAVQLKERRRLVVVPRETPLSLIGIRAMATLAEAGAVVLPASPGFYHQPKTIEDVLDSVVDRVLDQVGLSDGAIRRWNP